MSLKATVLGYILYFVHLFLRLTWRVEIRESDSLKKRLAAGDLFVAAHWHGEELGILHLLSHYKVACMVSKSFDGELVTKIIELNGSRAVRGSSSRGAVQALKGILRLAKEGWRPSVAVDGPRGPRYQVKPGVAEIAKILKAPIFTISMASSHPFIFKKSWNKSELPLPFSKILVLWGEEIPYDHNKSVTDHLPAIAQSLNSGRSLCLRQFNKSPT